MKIITIYEETKIAGTNIILEKGDEIQIIESTRDFKDMRRFLKDKTYYMEYFTGNEDHILYNLPREDEFKGKPRFLRLYTAGYFTTHMTKLKDAEVIHEGNGIEDLTRLCEELGCFL
jgi:hypothetical protein